MTGKRITTSPASSAGNATQDAFQPEGHSKVAPYSILNCTASAHEAATALQELALNHQNNLPRPVPRPAKSRKRERPISVDLSGSVQGSVRDMLASHCLAEITNDIRRKEDDSTVILPDGKVADSFLVPRLGRHQAAAGSENSKPKPMLTKDGPRKRTCGNPGKQEAQRIGRLVSERAMHPRPGMWDGII